eukprot:1895981-Karenia_brevis.AAC.1
MPVESSYNFCPRYDAKCKANGWHCVACTAAGRRWGTCTHCGRSEFRCTTSGHCVMCQRFRPAEEACACVQFHVMLQEALQETFEDQQGLIKGKVTAKGLKSGGKG